MVEVRFVGGPLDGKNMAIPEAPPIYYVQVPGAEAVKVYALGSDDEITISTECYYRERAEYYWQVVTYFWTEEERDRAFAEVTYDPDALPSGMLSACQDSA